MVGVICGVEFDRGEVYIDAFIFESIDKELEFRCGERGDLCWIERFVEADAGHARGTYGPAPPADPGRRGGQDRGREAGRRVRFADEVDNGPPPG